MVSISFAPKENKLNKQLTHKGANCILKNIRNLTHLKTLYFK